MIIDNVNNFSGAPLVASEIAEALDMPIVCIRSERRPRYAPRASGVMSNRAVAYLAGILLLLARPSFWALWMRTRTVICNTCLTFVYAALARLCGKHVIVVLHESFPKNLLYRIGLSISRRAAHVIVTPSRAAYVGLNLPEAKWRVIANTLPAAYFQDHAAVGSNIDDLYALFVGGGRAYKGGALFARARAKTPAWLHLHEFGSREYDAYGGSASHALGPEIYGRYHFVLILTDNRQWRETFGLIGCEAAASGALPIFTDDYAYRELWAPFADALHVKTYDEQALLARLQAIAADRSVLASLRSEVREHARDLCDPRRFRDAWRSACGMKADR